jgi:CheY-like chemotaxis protein
MDVQMAGLDGYEATRQIREFNKNVIVVALTGFGLTGEREKAIQAGCNDYFAKPVNKYKLKAVRQKYFSK